MEDLRVMPDPNGQPDARSGIPGTGSAGRGV
jgi:hypothetical protein